MKTDRLISAVVLAVRQTAKNMPQMSVFMSTVGNLELEAMKCFSSQDGVLIPHHVCELMTFQTVM